MIVGIDLGTTNSLISVWDGETSQIICNALGKKLTPSVISIDEDGSVLVGEIAKQRLVTHPDRTMATFKTFMGTRKNIYLADQTFKVEELSALVIKNLIENAQQALNQPIEEAIISVPAYFNNIQRSATIQAAEIAGIKVQRLINEPTAAALAYGLKVADQELSYLVLDLGGGTFDVSYMEVFDGVMEVHASSGDNHLGGEDFLKIIEQDFYQFNQLKKSDLSLYQQNVVLNHCEQLKINLSSQTMAEFKISLFDTEYSYQLSQQRFEDLSGSLLKKIAQPIEQVLRDARLNIHELDEVLLVGGATRMPMIRKLVTRICGQFPRIDLNPDEIVAKGCAVQAALKSRDQALKEVVMTDVAPYSLGIATHPSYQITTEDELVFSPIIERNTVIPTSKEQVFYKGDKFQKHIQVKIYQGESRRVADNVFLGEMNERIPVGEVEHHPLFVRFTYDINGVLEVEVKIGNTDTFSRKIINSKNSKLSQAEMKESLEKISHLKVHPRDLEENRLLLARAEKAFQMALNDTRQYISECTAKFEYILQRQDAKEIAQAKKDFEEVLLRFEKGEL
jgi:molecular chaperone HscC